MKKNDIVPSNSTKFTPLVDDLRQIINQSRNRVAANVNAELTLMYWHIGERINREVLGNERAEYGKLIVSAVSTQLSWSHFLMQRQLHKGLEAARERWHDHQKDQRNESTRK